MSIKRTPKALFDGTRTWVRLPDEAWPNSWKKDNEKLRNPVCHLTRALYGHPDAGGYWERHCEKHLTSQGFEVIAEEWRSCFWHQRLKLFLVVYVDDFKLEGPSESMAEG